MITYEISFKNIKVFDFGARHSGNSGARRSRRNTGTAYFRRVVGGEQADGSTLPE